MRQLSRYLFRNRALRIFAAALIASVVGLIVAAAVAFFVFMVSLFVVMPHSQLLWIFGSGLLLVLFGVAFTISFREMLEKMRQQ